MFWDHFSTFFHIFISLVLFTPKLLRPVGVFTPKLSLQAMAVWLLYPTFSRNSFHELPHPRPPHWVPICLQQELLPSTLPSCIPLPNSEVPAPLPCTNIVSSQTHLAMPPQHPQDSVAHKALQSGMLTCPPHQLPVLLNLQKRKELTPSTAQQCGSVLRGETFRDR